MENKTLYKKDTKGRIRVWSAEVRGPSSGEETAVVSRSGIDGGTIKESVTVTSPTTTMTPLEVAHSKLKTAYDKKLSNGYFDTREKAEAYRPSKLMLLHSIDKHADRIMFPAMAMPKLDGVCAGYMDDPEDPHFKGREDNRFPLMDAKAKEIKEYLDKLHGKARERMDSHGELYAHGRTISETVEGLKGDNEEIFQEIEFYIFDYMDSEAGSITFSARLRRGSDFYGWAESLKPFIPIKIKTVNSFEDIEEIHEVFVKQGFEGTVVANPDGVYEYDRRTYNKLKKKNLFSEEFEIVDTLYDNGTIGGVTVKLIKFQLVTKDGLKFPAVPKWSHTKRATAYEKKETYLGVMGTVEYRSVTKYGIPFHAVFINVRDYE